MYKRLMSGLIFGVMLALPLSLVTYVGTRAGEPAQTGYAESQDCRECHPSVQEVWTDSAHGQALSDPVFQEAWKAQGNPDNCLACHTTGYDPMTQAYDSEGVGCAACHDTENAPRHPDQVMGTERSSMLCGSCHTTTLGDWQVSLHGSDNIDCISCHTPHSISIKKGDVSSLCESCHEELVHNFAYSNHYDNDLMCTDCHLVVNEGVLGEGHGSRDHSFQVKLSTCGECHDETHGSPPGAAFVGPDEPPDALASIMSVDVFNEPEPVSPGSFMVLAAFIGIGAGVVLSPWLERLYRSWIQSES